MKKNCKDVLLQIQKALVVVGFSFVIVWGYAQIALNLSFLNPISEVIENFSITDKYYQMMPERENRYISIVDLTSLHDRQEIAQALEAIESCHPIVVGMDCRFKNENMELAADGKPKGNEAADNVLKKVVEKYRDNIVFSYELFDEENEEIGYTREMHSFFANEIPIHEGVCNMQGDNIYNGIKRQMKLGWTLNGKKVPSLVGEVVNIYVGDKLVRTDDENVNIKFAPTNFTIIHPDSILQHRQEIEGRIVFFGSMAEETDMHYTPLGKIAGVELLAYATQTLLEHSQIIEPPMWMQVIIAILLVMLTNMMQLLYLGWTSRSKSPLVYHVMGSAYLLGLVTFMWIALIMWFTFLFFCMYNVSMEIGWSIAAMAFLATSRSFYAACEDYYKLWKERKQHE